jgi:hypothetical protein
MPVTAAVPSAPSRPYWHPRAPHRSTNRTGLRLSRPDPSCVVGLLARFLPTRSGSRALAVCLLAGPTPGVLHDSLFLSFSPSGSRHIGPPDFKFVWPCHVSRHALPVGTPGPGLLPRLARFGMRPSHRPEPSTSRDKLCQVPLFWSPPRTPALVRRSQLSHSNIYIFRCRRPHSPPSTGDSGGSGILV